MLSWPCHTDASHIHGLVQSSVCTFAVGLHALYNLMLAHIAYTCSNRFLSYVTADTVVLLKFVDLIFNPKPADDRNVQ